MNQALEKAYESVTKFLPPALAGRLDLLRPSFRTSWGGPLNGQELRREIVRNLAGLIHFDRVLETGTYRGTTTEFLTDLFDAPVTTIEVNPRYFYYSSRRLAPQPDVTIEFDDSRRVLRRLAENPSSKTESVFIYLDSHGEMELPLSDELRIIASAWTRAIVMIDDFQVPDDDGYAYLEDYGPGMCLSEDYLPADALSGWSLSYPSAPSEEETGSKRGCCVLASPALAAAGPVPGLRESRIL